MSFSFHHLFAIGRRRPFEQSKRCASRVGGYRHKPSMSVQMWRDQYLAAKSDDFCSGIGSADNSNEIEPVWLTFCPPRRQRIEADSCVIVVRQQHMFQTVITRKIKYFIAKYGLIEGGVLIGVRGQQRTPDPFAGVGQLIYRVATTRLQNGKWRAMGIGEHCLTATLRIATRRRQY